MLSVLALGSHAIGRSPAGAQTDPPPIGTDPTTRAIGVEVYAGGDRVLSRPTTTSQPPCVYPCASGTFQEAHAARATSTLNFGPFSLPYPRSPIVVEATGLTVTAHWHNCFSNFDGSISCYRDIKLASATALVRSVDVDIDAGGQGEDGPGDDVVRLSVGGAYSHCETDIVPESSSAPGRTTARTSIGSLAYEGSDLLHGGLGGPVPDDLNDLPPNLVIPLPVGTLVLNEQSPSAPSADVPIAVNALHLYTPTYEVIVAHSNCTR